jgi:hypothetical protein
MTKACRGGVGSDVSAGRWRAGIGPREAHGALRQEGCGGWCWRRCFCGFWKGACVVSGGSLAYLLACVQIPDLGRSRANAGEAVRCDAVRCGVYYGCSGKYCQWGADPANFAESLSVPFTIDKNKHCYILKTRPFKTSKYTYKFIVLM